MKTRKKPARDSDTRALASPGKIPHRKTNTEGSRNISSDPVVAEKDEVKIAEEKLRKRQEDKSLKPKI